MTKSSIAARALPVLIVAVVLGASLLMRPTTLSFVNTAFCGYGYGYGTRPAVDGISPTIGRTAGGTSVVITGCGFSSATSVKFGTSAATYTVNSDTQITSTSPAHALGTVDVTVTTALGTSPTSAADQFTYSNGCTAVSLSASPTSPQRSGTPVTLTANGTCPSASGNIYEFWAKWAGTSTWQLLRGFTTSNTYNWDSNGAAPGIETFGVWVKDATSTAAYDAVNSITYQVTAACDGVTISALPTSVAEGSGTHSVITANAVNCVHAAPLYEFWAKWAGTNTWQLLRGFATGNTYDWNSTGAKPGVENFGVWVKDVKSSQAYDAYNSTTVTVTAATCGPLTAAPVPPTVVHGVGTSVVITATETGSCTTSPLFEFWIRPASVSTWTLVKAYSSSNTYTWDSHGAAAGTVYFGVWVKDGHSSNLYDNTTNTFVTVT